jgi:hemolysin III
VNGSALTATLPGQAQGEELANTVTHGLGALGSIAACVLLIVQAAAVGDPWKIVTSSIFGASLIALYLASTLYHAARAPRIKARLKVVDHATIYVLIAGTYTPFTLVGLRGGWGWSLFGVIWGLAVAGVVFKFFLTGRYTRLSTGIYVAMGWLVLIAVVPMVRELSPRTLVWLVAGGLWYTSGTAFYHARRLPYAHAVWHVFVMMGSLCHVLAVASQV